MAAISHATIQKHSDTEWAYREKLWFGTLMLDVDLSSVHGPSQLQLEVANRFMEFCTEDTFRKRLDFWVYNFFRSLVVEDAEAHVEYNALNLDNIRSHYEFFEMAIPYQACDKALFYVCGAGNQQEVLLRVSGDAVQLVRISGYSGTKRLAYHWGNMNPEDLHEWLNVDSYYMPPDNVWSIPS